MARPYRTALGGYVYHMLNRGNGRLRIFHKDGDYEAFERILGEALERVPGMRLLAYCLLPNHWHLVVWPRHDGALSDFGHWLTLTHTQRWHAHYHDVGGGHLYQGRFKSFPVAQDDHFLRVCHYVERNAARAGLVRRAEGWPWCSLWQRAQEPRPEKPLERALLVVQVVKRERLLAKVLANSSRGVGRRRHALDRTRPGGASAPLRGPFSPR